MKKIITFLLSLNTLIATAQNPLIVKSVGTTVLQPNTTTNSDFWKYNEWNGMRFYQGTGTPIKLCVTDGTTAGTKYITDIGSGSALGYSLTFVYPAQDFIYLLVYKIISGPPYISQTELWRSDGTASGTSLVYTFEQNADVSFGSTTTNTQNYSVVGNTIFFRASTAANGNELWKSDGTTAGTAMVKDIRTGTASSTPAWFCKIGNEVFFSATETYPNNKLWKTDGTAAGTVQVPVAEPFYTGYGEVAIINNKMIFYATDGFSPLNFEPYVTDGTAAGTFKLADINPAGSSYPSYQPEVQFRQNSRYAFFVSTNGTNTSLWRTDGTIAGTIQLSANADNVQSGGSSGSLSDIDENGLWMLNYSSGGSRLFKSDGTVAGTYLAASNLTNAGYLKIYKGAAWFRATRMGASDDYEPWRSGGNAATTNRALDISVGSYFTTMLGSGPFGYFVKNDKLYFFATNNSNYPFGVLPMALYQYTGDFTFNGSLAGGRWRDSTNWNSMMPPGITDTVNINGGTPNALNVNGANAYAGVLNLQNNATINFTNSTDSLFVNTMLGTGINNNFTGTGALVLRNVRGDTIPISNGFAANNIAVQSKANLITGNIGVNNFLNLTNNGKLILNNNSVTLQGNTSTALSDGLSYVVTNGTGRMTIQNVGIGARTNLYILPIGTSSFYNPVRIENTGTADNFSVRVQPKISANYSGETPIGGNYVAGVVDATWFITEATAGGSNASIMLQWNGAQNLGGFNYMSSKFGHYNLGAWQIGSTFGSGGDPYYIAGNGITSFSPFGVLSNSAVLPISNINLSLLQSSNKNLLSWNANVSNAVKIEIQKSTDALFFYSIETKNYIAISNYTDAISNNTKTFYRLKITDVNGKIMYSNIVVAFVNNSNKIQVYPTITNSSITVQNNIVENAFVQIISRDGKVVLQQTLLRGTNIIMVENIAAGSYFYQIRNSSKAIQTGKIIKY